MTIPYPTPVTVNPTGGPILPGQNLDNPTNSPLVPAPVNADTKTPPVSTAVVSSTPAVNDVNNIKQTLTQAQQDLQNQGSINAANTANDATAAATAKATADAKASEDAKNNTPEQQIMNDPGDGQHFLYNAQGDKITADATKPIPAGYSTTNPVVAPKLPVTASTTDSEGNQILQYTDGAGVTTYGKLNAMGQYVGATTPDQFNLAKTGSDLLSKLTSAANGQLPLNSSQQAQIDAVTNVYKQMIAGMQETTAKNQNMMSNLSNLYGGGVSMGELGTISGFITEGINKINQAQVEMVKAIADMTRADQQDNISNLRDAYNNYKDNATAVQNNIDKIQAKARQDQQDYQAEIDKKQAVIDNQNSAADASIRSIIADASKNGVATPEQLAKMNDALKTHDYAGAIAASAGTLQDPTSTAGQYNAYVKQQKALGKPVSTPADFISAQKYKDAYAAASASAAAQGAFTTSDKNQSKLESSYITGLQRVFNARAGDLGSQTAKVSSAIHAQKMLDATKDANGNYNVPQSQYKELVMSAANLITGTGAITESQQRGLEQATAEGDWNKAMTYISGSPQTATSQEVIQNLADIIKRQGIVSEGLRNQDLKTIIPNSDLAPERASYALNHVLDNLPSYTKMSEGDIQYLSPAEINDKAVSAVSTFLTDPINGVKNSELYQKTKAQYPNASPTDLAQIFGLIPTQ
jgi:hypothetical protein